MTAIGPLDELSTPTAARLVDQALSLAPGPRPRVVAEPCVQPGHVEIHRQTSCVTVEIIGTIGEANRSVISGVVDDVIATLTAGQHIRVDLERCSGLDCSVLTDLEDARELAAEKDAVLYLARVSQPLLREIGTGHGGLLRLSWF